MMIRRKEINNKLFSRISKLIQIILILILELVN